MVTVGRTPDKRSPDPSLDTNSGRVLPSQLVRKWRRVGRILNIANTLSKLEVEDRWSAVTAVDSLV